MLAVGAEMAVSDKHLHRLVSCDHPDFHHVKVGVLEQPAGRFMPQSVEAQDLDACFYRPRSWPA